MPDECLMVTVTIRVKFKVNKKVNDKIRRYTTDFAHKMIFDIIEIMYSYEVKAKIPKLSREWGKQYTLK